MIFGAASMTVCPDAKGRGSVLGGLAKRLLTAVACIAFFPAPAVFAAQGPSPAPAAARQPAKLAVLPLDPQKSQEDFLGNIGDVVHVAQPYR